jgi:hypothetical protein
MMAHTRMRFDTMTEQKLWTRMGKTTSREKLRCFALVAQERGMRALATAADAKHLELYGMRVLPEREIRPVIPRAHREVAQQRQKAKPTSEVPTKKTPKPKTPKEPVRFIRI